MLESIDFNEASLEAVCLEMKFDWFSLLFIILIFYTLFIMYFTIFSAI